MIRHFIITDTHFYDNDFIKDGLRPKNYSELIIRNLQNLLLPDDILIHLGDVMGKNKDLELKEILKSICGTKILIMGNHDHLSRNQYLERGFSLVVESMTIGGYLLTHIPVSKPILEFCSYNIHGHFHDMPIEKWEYNTYEKHRLLAIEKTNYQPVLLEKILRKTSSTTYGLKTRRLE